MISLVREVTLLATLMTASSSPGHRRTPVMIFLRNVGSCILFSNRSPVTIMRHSVSSMISCLVTNFPLTRLIYKSLNRIRMNGSVRDTNFLLRHRDGQSSIRLNQLSHFFSHSVGSGCRRPPAALVVLRLLSILKQGKPVVNCGFL
jgi:hypothetical protein